MNTQSQNMFLVLENAGWLVSAAACALFGMHVGAGAGEWRPLFVLS